MYDWLSNKERERDRERWLEPGSGWTTADGADADANIPLLAMVPSLLFLLEPTPIQPKKGKRIT